MNCPSLEQLFAFSRNQLPDGEATLIRAHLEAGCETCRKELDELQQILTATARRGLSEPLDWLIHQAMNLFRWYKSKGGERVHQGIPGFLVVNNRLLLDYRSGGATSQHLLYRAGNYDVDLLIEYIASTRSANIIGQSMPIKGDPEAVAHGQVELFHDSRMAVATKTDRAGRFTLNGIEEGIYDLKLRFKGEEIDIVGLKIPMNEN